MQRSAEPVELPSGVVTFLMTDVAGSTALWEKHPREMSQAAKLLDSLISLSVGSNDGVLIKDRGEGDSHFAVFGSAMNGARAALAISKSLSEQSWPTPNPIKVRMALNTGEAELRSSDYYGQVVNRCARIRSAAHPEQILLSDQAARLLLQTGEFSLSDLGVHTLKDLLEPVRIYQLDVHDGLLFPPIKSLSSIRHNLPRQFTSFVGRKQTLETLNALIRRNRLVTLLGAGGSGKTRLAVEAAADLTEEFPGGVWFFDLSRVTNAGNALSDVFGYFRISSSPTERMATLCSALDREPTLLILDNCEHLVDGIVLEAKSLLERSTRTHLLATSRQPFQLVGEQVYVVPPLKCSLDNNKITIQRVTSLEAVELFCERATGRTGKPTLSEHNYSDIYTLCKRLDGIPLAIEHAASHFDYLSAREILEKIDQTLAILSNDDAGIEERHRSIEATVTWSFSMLSEDEKALLLNLSYFRGGFSAAAARGIWGPSHPGRDLDHLLKLLVRKSLLLSTDHFSGAKRFRILEPIRDYCARFRQPLNEGSVARFVSYYLLFCEEASTELATNADSSVLSAIEADHGNILLSIELAHSTEDDETLALKLCVQMHRYWLKKGHIKEARDEFAAAMAKARNCPADLLATSHNIFGVLSWYSGNAESARRHLTTAQELFERLADEEHSAAVLNNLALLALDRRDFSSARNLFLAAYRKFQHLGLGSKATDALENIAATEYQLGNYRKSTKLYRRAAKAFSTGNSRDRLAHVLQNLIAAQALDGTLRENLQDVRHAITAALSLNDPHNAAHVLRTCALVASEKGDPERASRYLAASQAIWSHTELRLTEPEQQFYQFVESRVTLVCRNIAPASYENSASFVSLLQDALVMLYPERRDA